MGKGLYISGLKTGVLRPSPLPISIIGCRSRYFHLTPCLKRPAIFILSAKIEDVNLDLFTTFRRKFRVHRTASSMISISSSTTSSPKYRARISPSVIRIGLLRIALILFTFSASILIVTFISSPHRLKIATPNFCSTISVSSISIDDHVHFPPPLHVFTFGCASITDLATTTAISFFSGCLVIHILRPSFTSSPP